MALLLPGIAACKKKNKSTEYFSFDANGVHYDYPQDVKEGFGTSRKALYAAGSSASVGYFIVGSSFKNPAAEGSISFNFSGNQIPNEDTIILDGLNNKVTVGAFLDQEDYYKMRSPMTGKIIFTERTAQRLTGTFEFDVELYRTPSFGNIVWTDTILHVTNGKFSIIPAH